MDIISSCFSYPLVVALIGYNSGGLCLGEKGKGKKMAVQTLLFKKFLVKEIPPLSSPIPQQ